MSDAYTYETAASAPRHLRSSARAIPFEMDFRGPFVHRFIRPDNASEVLSVRGASTEAMRMQHLSAAFMRAVRDDGGAFIEFGVGGGTSLRHLASLDRSIKWHGFDSFQGMPGDPRDAMKPRRPAPPREHQGPITSDGLRIVIHPGWFNTTARRWLDDLSHRHRWASFVHMDAHVYSSTVDVLSMLASRCALRRGTIVAFDELFGHPTLRRHEWKALREAAQLFCFTFTFVTFMLHPASRYGRVAIRIRPEGECEERACVRGRGFCWSPKGRRR